MVTECSDDIHVTWHEIDKLAGSLPNTCLVKERLLKRSVYYLHSSKEVSTTFILAPGAQEREAETQKQVITLTPDHSRRKNYRLRIWGNLHPPQKDIAKGRIFVPYPDAFDKLKLGHCTIELIQCFHPFHDAYRDRQLQVLP